MGCRDQKGITQQQIQVHKSSGIEWETVFLICLDPLERGPDWLEMIFLGFEAFTIRGLKGLQQGFNQIVRSWVC